MLIRTLAKARQIGHERGDGCRLLSGLEWDEGYLQRWAQTWLCAPNYDVGVEALQRMDEWLNQRYERRLRELRPSR
jgi:hypothetical protein